MKKDIIWKAFGFDEINLSIINSKPYHAKNLEEDSNGIAYLSRSRFNNSLNMTVKNQDNFKLNPKNTISFGAESARFFYQPFKYITGNKMYYITNDRINKCVGLFLQVSLQSSVESSFSFGNGMIPDRVCRKKIVLPVDVNGEPDWKYMEDYIQDLEIKKLSKCVSYLNDSYNWIKIVDVPSLSEKNWNCFKLLDIFDDYDKGNQNDMNSLKNGNIPLISAKKVNNGLKSFVSSNKHLYPKHSISINNDGDGGAGLSYYHTHPYYLDSHCTCLIFEKSPGLFISEFLTCCINKQRMLFGHARAITENRLKSMRIMLPVDTNGNPDYEYMENYMKNMFYKKYQSFINYTSKYHVKQREEE